MPLDYTGERFMPGRDGAGIHLEHLHRYSLAAATVDGTVLDLGCGVGYGSRLLARAARRVVAVDLSPECVAFASREFAAPALDYVVADARRLPFRSASFDWIVCFELIEHLLEGEAVVAELGRVLTPGGHLLLSTPNRPIYSEARGYSNPFHPREFDALELRALLSAVFGGVALFGQRLVAGSVVWDLAREAPRRRLEAFQPDPDLGKGLRQDEGPTYLVALCSRRRRPRGPDGYDSVLTARLEAFLEEQAARASQAEAAIRAEYQAIVDRLVVEVGESDARVRHFGAEIERLQAERLDEKARLSGELAQERSRTLGLERQALRGREERVQRQSEHQAAVERLAAQLGEFDARIRELVGEIDRLQAERQEQVARLSAELAQERSTRAGLHEQREGLERTLERERLSISEGERLAAELRHTLEQARIDLDWCYRQWQAREAELQTIRQSRTWRYATAARTALRAMLSPLDSFRRLAQRMAGRSRAVAGPALRALARGLGWLYLVCWTAGACLGAAWRRRSLHTAGPDQEPRALAAGFRRRPRILMVCPYQLFPADHGGGVRAYNLVRRLSRRCDIQLLVFIRGHDDPEQRGALEPWVEKLYFHSWQPTLRPDRWGLEPPSAQLFESQEVRSLVEEILSRERIDILQLEYTELGQYGLPLYSRVKVVLSEIDITFRSRIRRRRAGLHRRYAADRLFGHSWSDCLRQFRYELKVARRADQVQVMSRADGDYLARFLPGGRGKLRVVPNAVDLDEYRPPVDPSQRSRQLLFVGNFEHLPNLDALDYLLSDVWPGVRRRVPDAELVVVGARGGEPVRRHHGRDGVTVVGAVPATRPYYQGSRALLAPIRAGSGTRLKILEALACELPVATTTIGAEGIDGLPDRHFLIGDTAARFTRAVCRLLEDDGLCVRLGRAGRELVERAYGWEQSADAALAGYACLMQDAASCDAPAGAADVPPPPPVAGQVDVSVIIPTLSGGAVFERCLAAVRRQRTERTVEIVCVDSGSSAADLAAMERHGARVIPIQRSEFNHGLTRDLGAAASRGCVLVFINQDAVPCDEQWLEGLTAPLFATPASAAVQGGIVEIPEGGQRFYWDSCGERFYFTRESRRWIERHFGVGFSTINAAMRRDAWARQPFGYAPIMEDKKWQRVAVAAGLGIALAPGAAVFHTHNYGLRSLSRRCHSEGFGWRTLGERYSLLDMLSDMLQSRVYADLLRGLRRGQVRSWAELLFPWLRPLLVYGGNRWGRAVWH